MSAPWSASLTALAVATLLATPAVTRAETLRCQGGIVAVGDWKHDLLGKCGRPTLREVLTAPTGALGLRGGSQARATLERWTYDFGPSAFLQVATVEVGVVKAIERGGYGGDAGRPRPEPARLPRARCELPDGFRVGDSTFDVLARCGEPATRDETLGQVAVEAPVGSGSSAPIGLATVRVEIWTYDFGPRAFVRRLEFEEGWLARIVTGGYGYAR